MTPLRLLGILARSLIAAPATALRGYLEQHRGSGVTERLNAIYGSEPELSELDPVLRGLQSRSTPKDGW